MEPDAEKDLLQISDTKTREAIVKALLKLEDEPEKRGKLLSDDLEGFYSIRCAGQRYRAIYAIEVKKLEVHVLAIGIRKEGDKKDAYNVASKRLN